MAEPRGLDVVKFDVPIDGWPAGTRATLLEPHDSVGTFEVANERGETLALVDAHYKDVTVIWIAAPESNCY